MPTVFEIVTERITAKLEQGVIPWRRPWHAESGLPRNLVSGKEYRGINVFLLGCQGYESQYWLTFRQAKELGGSVRKGEKARTSIPRRARKKRGAFRSCATSQHSTSPSVRA